MKEKRKNLLILLGYSNAGKDTILRELHPLLQPLVSHTTRPKRPMEQDGVDYYFIDESAYFNIMDEGKFLDHRFYNTIQNGEPTVWRYGLNVDELFKDGDDYVVIIDFDGTKEILENKPEWLKVYTVFVDVTEENRVARAKLRQGYEEAEFKRRLTADYEHFKGVKDFVDLVVPNNNDSIEESTYKIIREYSKWRLENE